MKSDEQEIRDLVATWLSATKARETGKVLDLMAEDVVFLQPGQPPMRGRSGYAHRKKVSAIAQFDIEGVSDIQEIRVFGDWAYCWNHLTVVFTPRDGGSGGKRAGHVLSILQKQDSKWVIVRDANMLTTVLE